MPRPVTTSNAIARFVAGGCLVALAGCAAPGPAPLYLWGNFPRQQYVALQHDAASPDEQIRDMQAVAEKARGSHAALPPGFRAHLGMLHLGAGSPQKAQELWEAEKAAFPESAPYMDQLLKKLVVPAAPVAPTAPAKTEKPA